MTQAHIYTTTGMLFNSEREILPFMGTWMKMEDILLSKKSENKLMVWAYLYVEYKHDILIESMLMLTRGKGGGKWEAIDQGKQMLSYTVNTFWD
jgi:hypothetical protein